MSVYEWKCPSCGKDCQTRVPYCSRYPKDATERAHAMFKAVLAGEREGPLCTECRDKRSEEMRKYDEAHPRLGPDAPPRFVDSWEEWAPTAIARYEHRNDPKPPPDPSFPDLSALYAMNYDVLDNPEQKAFEAWLEVRDDRLLWRWSYGGSRTCPLLICAQRAVPFEGGKITFMDKPSSIGQFIAESWSELRRMIETTEERSKGS